MTPSLAFVLLAVSGLLMILVEVFMPGAVFGVIGGVLLVAAGVTSFAAFGSTGGVWACLGLLLGGGGILLLWLKIFPHTPIGRALTLRDDTPGRANPDASPLMDAEGESLSDLRPAGMARIAGARRDVLAESGWVDAGRRVRVVKVEGGRVVVREIRS
ncbi:MAG: NfeD family protein [Kiritimatiellia bacterium]